MFPSFLLIHVLFLTFEVFWVLVLVSVKASVSECGECFGERSDETANDLKERRRNAGPGSGFVTETEPGFRLNRVQFVFF